MLRKGVIVVTAVALVVAIGLLTTGSASTVVLGVWLAFSAAVLLLAILFERGRYRPTEAGGPWVRSTERFQDPTTGRWVQVEYNPRTGERRYLDEQ